MRFEWAEAFMALVCTAALALLVYIFVGGCN